MGRYGCHRLKTAPGVKYHRHFHTLVPDELARCAVLTIVLFCTLGAVSLALGFILILVAEMLRPPQEPDLEERGGESS